jgi:hypothetical protein
MLRSTPCEAAGPKLRVRAAHELERNEVWGNFAVVGGCSRAAGDLLSQPQQQPGQVELQQLCRGVFDSCVGVRYHRVCLYGRQFIMYIDQWPKLEWLMTSPTVTGHARKVGADAAGIQL